MTQTQKKQLFRIGLAALFLAIGMFIPDVLFSFRFPMLSLSLADIILLLTFALIGWDILLSALRNILRGQIFDENFLMSIATIGALILGEYAEAAAVMLFYQLGEWFQVYAVEKSRRSITELMDIRPDFANVFRAGEVLRLAPETVEIGEEILVKPGERIPLDGIITQGSSLLDTSALTGESLPRQVAVDSEVLAGCINQSGVLHIRVTRDYGESTVAKILELVEDAGSKKSKSEKFISKFARVYTPVVVASAVILALLPPLLLGGGFSEWIERALIFLVISCPCALVLSIPLSFFGGIGGASKRGILVKGSNYLEALSKIDTVVFDKTGTLTKGSFSVSRIDAHNIDSERLLELAAYAESQSTHPISRCIREAYGREFDNERVKEISEESGYGVRARVDGCVVAAGNRKYMVKLGVEPVTKDDTSTVVHVSVDGQYSGVITIEDEIKADAKNAIVELNKVGVKRIVMLTGDSTEAGERTAAALGINDIRCELLPGDKVRIVEELMEAGGKLVFTGDGINDAPVLARADIGVAMGGLGSDAAIEAADIVLMTDEPSRLATAVRISRKTLRIVRQNIVIALGVKGAVLILGALGYASMWAAIFSDVGVLFIAVLNAIRALQTESSSPS